MSFLSFAGDLLGAAVAQSSSKRANAANMEIARQNMALQREFAQHGVRWKVEDAKQAGIHPLYALGASTTSFSPVNAFQEASDVGHNLSNAGQSLSRAVDSTATKRERLELRAAAQQVQMNDIEIAKAQAELALLNQPASGPPMPGDLPPYAVDGTFRRIRKGIDAVSLDPPRVDEYGNPVFYGPSTVVEPYRRTPHQEFEDYYGDLPSEVWSAGNVIRRVLGR